MIPGVSDALFARIVAREKFEAIYMTGAGATAVRLGMPDIGLLTLTEMADNAARIADSSGLPLISDADNGYGGALNVRRTVQMFERAGVAAIHIEDQVLPKRCGHMSGKQVIPAEEMVGKIKAAVDARVDENFVIIARSDAIAIEGLDRTLERAALYEAAGADVLFFEAPRDREQMRRITSAFAAPQLYNMASSGKTPFLAIDEIEALGFKLVIYPNWLLFSAITAATGTLRELRASGTVAEIAKQVTTFTEFFDLLGMKDVQAMEERYGVPEAGRARY